MLTILILLGVAAVMYGYALRTLRQRRRLTQSGEVVDARIAATGTGREGDYYVLEFSTAGGTHRLQYPYPSKAGFCRVGDTVTLHYDPYHPENLFVEEDKSPLRGVWFCLGCGAVLTVMALLYIL